MSINQNTVVSIVIPLQQDAKILKSLVEEIDLVIGQAFRFFEVVLVDDGSRDDTPAGVREILKQTQRIRYMRLSRPFGRDVALSAGIESAIGDFVVTMDPLSDPVSVIPEMIELCRKSGGVVHGIAANPPKRSIIRNFCGGVFRMYARKHLGIDIKHGVSDLRVMSRQAVNALLQIKEQNRHLRVLTLTLGYRHEFHAYELKSRDGTRRPVPLRGEVATAIDLLAANTRHPLRIVTLGGLLGAFINMVYAGYVVVIYLTKDDVASGWTTLSLQVSGMFFFVCLTLTVLSEYVATILGEVRGRPLYFIAEEVNSSVLMEDTVRSSLVAEADHH